MQPNQLSPEQLEADDLLTDLETHAAGYGWTLTRRGVNASFAYGTFEREYDPKLQAFYAVDSTKPDKFICGDYVADKSRLRRIIEAKPRTTPPEPKPYTGKRRGRPPKASTAKTVPPTDDSPVPPTEDSVPPTDDSAVPPTEQDTEVPPTEGETVLTIQTEQGLQIDYPINDEWEDPDPPVDFPAPYAVEFDQTEHDLIGVEIDGKIFVGTPDEDDPVESATEQLSGVKQALDKLGGTIENGLISATEEPEERKNWSSLTSVLTEDELLAEVAGSEVHWINRISGHRESAVVSKSERHPPKVTPEGFDPDEFGEDLRVLHFIESGSGFRSVAVARIVKIG